MNIVTCSIPKARRPLLPITISHGLFFKNLLFIRTLGPTPGNFFVCSTTTSKSTSHLNPSFFLTMLSLRVARSFHVSAVTRQSICPAGTVLNLKIRKSGDEPVALKDEEYPDWLWDCLDKAKMDKQLKENDVMKWRKKQINKANNAKIKNNNFVSQM